MLQWAGLESNQGSTNAVVLQTSFGPGHQPISFRAPGGSRTHFLLLTKEVLHQDSSRGFNQSEPSVGIEPTSPPYESGASPFWLRRLRASSFLLAVAAAGFEPACLCVRGTRGKPDSSTPREVIGGNRTHESKVHSLVLHASGSPDHSTHVWN